MAHGTPSSLDEMPEYLRLVRGGRPADSLLLPIARTWQFRAAKDDDEAVRSHVLLALVVRAPQLYDGPTLGTPSGTMAAASSEMSRPPPNGPTTAGRVAARAAWRIH